MSAELRAEISAVNRRFTDGAGNSDIDAMGSVYTEDARIMPPGSPTIQGRDAIKQFWAGAAEALGITGVDLTTEVLDAHGDEAHELGAFTIHGADGVLDKGKYVVIWNKTSDGWRWHWDIWNSNDG